MLQSPLKPNILIVEDEWIIALDIKRHLSKLGYGIAGTANSAEKALALVAETQPDLVLMDIYLQGEKSGIEAADQIHQQFNLPVVFLTAHADEATLMEAIAAHPYGYIAKPFEEKDLSIAIQVALANHRAEQAIQQALDKEKQLNELKSQFVSIVSHEFRNPLSSLLITLEMLEKQEGFPPEKRQAQLQRAKNVVREMNHLIQDVLVVGEVEREQFQCQLAPVDIYWFCSALVEDLRAHHASNHRLVFHTQGISDHAHPFYHLDPKLLQHILANLLENALKYSTEDSEVMFELECASEWVQFRIQDRGIGLTDRDLAKLFTPFHRGINVGNISGTGLGLSIVKKCVDAHQGTITVKSEVGVGSLFTVTLYSKVI